MKILVKFLAVMVLFVSMSIGLKAQEGTYVDEFGVQDSSYMEDLFMEEEGTVGTKDIALYVVIAVVVIGGAIYFIRKKKK